MPKKFIIILVFLLFTGCNSPNSNQITIDINQLGPQKIVETYYKSLSIGDSDLAKKCLSTRTNKTIYTAPDSEFKNLRKLTNLKVSREVPIKLYGKNYQEVQVVAEYDATYNKTITSNNGKQIRFVYVAKETEHSPWRIISIGTGP